MNLEKLQDDSKEMKVSDVYDKITANNYKESNDTFARFAADRIRKDINAKATFKEINTAYNNWKLVSAGSAASISSQDLENRLNEEFGEPRNKKYYIKQNFPKIILNKN